MNSMTSTSPVANSVFVAVPHGEYPVIPGSMSQVPPYLLNQPQVYLMPGNPPGLKSPISTQPAQRSLKEGRVLGAIQILIGLIHIGLGSVLGVIVFFPYIAISFYGGYPFWGGILFIISGSLTVASEKQPNSSCLLNGSLGLNICSAICSMVGIMLFITDLCINPSYIYHQYYRYLVNPGIPTFAVLMIFSLLEFCISSTAAHFGCLLVCYAHNNGPLVIPNIYVTNPVANPEPVNSLPHSNEIQDSQ
ncbi:PREDICTED: membrane-spanning 4-domains subfamily A member 8-like [Miniopterus natalensis]|uniref:membrane-spanning 4-domains subfamily A member 8-like n=1 Tax=Miniopterus natalensis TaxID=291302 RepID=UPI0007A71646|nr:PREDICTED: membrane-spanning 4-domains subfamily A member 8-like [Miniopterus natalensis]